MKQVRSTILITAVSVAVCIAGCQRGSKPEQKAEGPAATPGDIVPPRYSQVVGGSGANLAFDGEAETVDPRLTEHSRKMAQAIFRTTDNVYCAVGYGLANMTMIEGSDGIVIIDTLESTENARLVMNEFRRITDKPVKAIIYTHNHYDHVMGTDAVVDPEEIHSGKVPVIAHERMMEGLLHQLSVVGEAVLTRSLYSFGNFLDKGPRGSVNEGIGPTLISGPTGFIPPTQTFHDQLDLNIAGVHLQLLYSPSETDDEIVVWLPEKKLLQSAEVIQGETFPNLYTIRGTTFRNPVNWYKSIDRLRELEPEYLVPSHGRPVEGKAEVESLLRSYRDAIQYAHDQAVRLINKGYTPDELADALPALPPHLAAHPWLTEFYGTVKHSVRNFYNGYLGWFPGDPTVLDPAPPVERAQRYVDLMGGRDAVVKAAQAAFDKGQYQWCAELLTYVIRIKNDDNDARQLKASALRQLGFAQANINWRNFYLTSALELDNQLDVDRYSTDRGLQIIARLPFLNLLENITTRLDAQKAMDVRQTLMLHVTDTDKRYGLEIRRGIVQLYDHQPPHVDVTLSGTEEVLRGVLLRQRSAVKELVLRNIQVDPGATSLADFFSYFEGPSGKPFPLAAR